MAERREYSNTTRLELELQKERAENARLRSQLSAATATISTVRADTGAANIVLDEYLRNHAGVHPSAKPKKRKRTDDMLKGAEGAVLTRREMIERLKEQEAATRAKEQVKEARKDELQAAKQLVRKQRAEEKKRQKSEEQKAAATAPARASTPAMRKPSMRKTAAQKEATTEGSGGWMGALGNVGSFLSSKFR